MWGFFNRVPFKGLANSCCKKMLKDTGLPRESAGVFLLPALMMAHAAYPKARWGKPEIDEAIERFPTPIVGWDEAGKLAHRYAHFNEMSADQCLIQQYGMNLKDLLEYTTEVCV